MKKPVVVIAVTALVLAIVVIRGIGTYPIEAKAPTINNEVVQETTSKIVSENGLEDWTITMTPRLQTKAQYNGKSAIQDVKIKFSTGVTLEVPTLQPESPIGLQGKETTYIGKVNVDIEWVDKGEKHNGDVIFQMDSVK